MLRKINQKNLQGKDLYQVVTIVDGKKVFGKVGTLQQLQPQTVKIKNK